MLADTQRESIRTREAAFFEIGQQPLIGEIQRMRVFPVVARNMVQSFHQMLIVHFDGQLAPAVKASWGEIDGTDDRALAVSQQHLGVELEVFELVDLNANVVENTDAAYTLDQLFHLKRVGCPGHHVDGYSTACRPHEAFDDDSVLVAL